MDVLSQLETLDGLLVSETQAPATAKLRNQLSTVREQIEALYSAHSELKREHSVFIQTTADQIADLKQKNSKLVLANEELVAKNEELETQRTQPKSKKPEGTDLAEEAIKILEFLFDRDGAFTAEFIAQSFSLPIGMAKYHLDTLQARKYVGFADVVVMRGSPLRYKPMTQGRAFVASRR